jgi:type IV secretion system protein VirD4
MMALLIAAAAFGLAVVIALAGLHRLTPQLNLVRAVRWLWWFRGDRAVRRWLLIGALASLGGLAIVAHGLVRSLRPPLHGAARWASEGELSRQGLRAKDGVILGRKGGRLIVFGGDEHVLLYAPTRTGKGVGVVIPNLLNWPGSVVVLDVKRENYEASAGFRAAHGQKVLLFDPLDAEGRTARFNPLGHIDRGDPHRVMDELQKIAAMLFPVRENSDPFWAEAARTGLIGVGAYVAETPGLCFSLGAIFSELTRGEPKRRLTAILAARADAGEPLSEGCTAALTDFCSASDNTFASIKQTITSRMNLWLSPRVRAATEVSDFDLRDLQKTPISLYLCVSPDNLPRIAPLYSLLLQQLVDAATRKRPDGDAASQKVLVVLDEFARLGHAPVIAGAFSFVAGYGLRLLLVLQSPAQLRAEYGPHVTEEIISNCGAEVVFAPKDIRLAHQLSERLGYHAMPGRSVNRPAGLFGGRGSTTESEQRRALMLPQELIQLGPGQLIVLRSGMAPVLGEKIVYWRERAFRRRLRPAPVTPQRARTAPGPDPTRPGPSRPGPPPPGQAAKAASDPDPDLEAAVDKMSAAGIKALAPNASPEDVKDWTLGAAGVTAMPARRRKTAFARKAKEQDRG